MEAAGVDHSVLVVFDALFKLLVLHLVVIDVDAINQSETFELLRTKIMLQSIGLWGPKIGTAGTVVWTFSSDSVHATSGQCAADNVADHGTVVLLFVALLRANRGVGGGVFLGHYAPQNQHLHWHVPKLAISQGKKVERWRLTRSQHLAEGSRGSDVKQLSNCKRGENRTNYPIFTVTRSVKS
ncbi:hypothetical protein BCR34DRAFT_606169 [Clohesyomyces aquaticus]|uniref:Uncharacterized protein n=1 Tax=Clohesyomyces aquaticus TaxID=1231657 RepID=A0A1Y1YRZ6_9PLEO|nr:hypothetical protein BCR34DRAFT_606169 [Clohesyomyces aquaticus]